MANNNGANGTSQKTAEEMRQWYEQHKTAIEKYEKAQSLINIIDPSKNESRTYTTFSRETFRTYMRNPANYYKRLIELSKFLYTRSNPYRKLINYNASMINVNYRSIIPLMDQMKEINEKKVLKDYWETCKLMNRSNMSSEIMKMLIIAWREDTAFGCWYTDDTGIFILPLSYDYCKVDSIYPDGTLGFAYDMSYFNQRQDILEFWGEPFVSLYKVYQQNTTTNRWQHFPDDKAFVLKVNIDDPTLPLPPYSGLLDSVIALVDLADVQDVKDRAAIYKMLNFQLETNGDDEPDSFTVDPDTAIEYFNKAVENLPDYVSAFLSPLKVTEISFPETAAQDINLVENSTKALYNSSGGAQILNSSTISTTIGWTSALIADEQFGSAILRPQVENNINRLIDAERSNSCIIKLMPVSPYTKNMYKDSLKSDFTYGEPLKLALNTLNGYSELETVSMAKLEKMLDLNNLFEPPKSSNTMSNTSGDESEVGQGRPTVSDDKISDEGDASRDKG